LEGYVFKLFGALAVVSALVFGVIPASADPPAPASPAGLALGIVPVHSLAHNGASSGGNLLYHSGGTVETGPRTTYAVYLGTTSSTCSSSSCNTGEFNSGYQNVINKYFSDVAAVPGATTNVYYSDTQYYQTVGGTQYISYNEKFGGSWQDTALPSTSGCSNTSGGSVRCLSDAQIQQEVTKALAANPTWTKGTNSEVFVFLGGGLSTCSGSSCFVSQFCAYHSHYSLNGSTVLYANMPYTGYSAAACGSGQSPNGNSDADSTINVTSHEANETITDELGNAWFDRRGYENGDKCAWNFGPGGAYNQTINNDHYYLQGEWSNQSSGCVWTGK
jgi:hypothetical protein